MMRKLCLVACAGASLIVSPGTMAEEKRAGAGHRVMAEYPMEALRKGHEGDVGWTATISVEGKVLDCVVTQSSGWPELDEAACRGMMKFARFNAALDNAGKPIESKFSSTTRYRLPN